MNYLKNKMENALFAKNRKRQKAQTQSETKKPKD